MASPSEMFSCVNSDAILKSPINDSTAKTNWSFAKDCRFKKSKFYCDSFYNIPGLEKNDSRKAAIGYGKKTDLDYGKHPHNEAPSPDKYNISSFVQTNKAHKKGFSPYYSREDIAPMSYIDLEQAKVPGPGRYQQFRYNETPKWSMRPKVDDDLFPKTTALDAPAPCSYQNVEAMGKNPTGKYHLTNHRNSKAKTFNPPSSKRFRQSFTEVPGPGVYKPQNQLSAEGKYVMSRNVSAGKRAFMNGRRQSFIDLTTRRSYTPGPGSYRAPSDFGQYDSKKQRYSRMQKSQMLPKSQKIDLSKTGFSQKK